METVRRVAHGGGLLRILIVRIGAMGDVLHALPAVAAMRRQHPDWRIDWVVDERWRDLLAADGGDSGPVVDGMIGVRTREWNRRPLSLATLRDVLGLRRRLQAERYDVCVDLQGTMRSAVIGWMARGGRFVGPKEPREGPAMRLYGEAVKTPAVHVIDQAGEILGYAVEPVVRGSLVPLGARDEAWADEVVSASADRVMVMAPTAGWRSKEWPPERFGELAGRLVEEGWRVLVNAPPGEVGAKERSRLPSETTERHATATVPQAVVRASGGRALAVPCTIGQLASLLRRAKLFVGGDTGPMHLADALGVPVVALFGPTDPRRTGPVGKRVRVLRHAGSVTDHGRHRVTEAGLGRITVEEVFRAAMDLLEEEKADDGRNEDSRQQ